MLPLLETVLAAAFSLAAVIAICSPWAWRGASRKRRITAGIAFVVLLLAYELPRRQSNLYELMQVETGASASTVRRAFGALSKIYHPDVAGDEEEAQLTFARLRRARDILTSDFDRRNYANLGDFVEDSSMNDRIQTLSVLSALASYLTLFVLAAAATAPRQFTAARKFVCFYCILGFTLELQLRLFGSGGSWQRFCPIITHWLPFEIANLLLRLFPVVLAAGLLTSQTLFVDVAEVDSLMLRGILQTNRVLTEKLVEVIYKLEAVKGGSTQKSAEAAKAKTDDLVPVAQVLRSISAREAGTPSEKSTTTKNNSGVKKK